MAEKVIVDLHRFLDIFDVNNESQRSDWCKTDIANNLYDSILYVQSHPTVNLKEKVNDFLLMRQIPEGAVYTCCKKASECGFSGMVETASLRKRRNTPYVNPSKHMHCTHRLLLITFLRHYLIYYPTIPSSCFSRTAVKMEEGNRFGKDCKSLPFSWGSVVFTRGNMPPTLPSRRRKTQL